MSEYLKQFPLGEALGYLAPGVLLVVLLVPGLNQLEMIDWIVVREWVETSDILITSIVLATAYALGVGVSAFSTVVVLPIERILQQRTRNTFFKKRTHNGDHPGAIYRACRHRCLRYFDIKPSRRDDVAAFFLVEALSHLGPLQRYQLRRSYRSRYQASILGVLILVALFYAFICIFDTASNVVLVMLNATIIFALLILLMRLVRVKYNMDITGVTALVHIKLLEDPVSVPTVST